MTFEDLIKKKEQYVKQYQQIYDQLQMVKGVIAYIDLEIKEIQSIPKEDIKGE